MDVSYNICKEIIALAASGRRAAIATTSMFGVLGVTTLLASLVVLMEKKWLACWSWCVHIVIAVVYFYGKNIRDIVNKYGEELKCGEKCVAHNQIAAIGCLGFTLLILYAIPLLHKYINDKTNKRHHSLWHFFFGVILVLVSINSIYSAVLSIVPEQLKCATEALILSIVFLIVASLLGWLTIFTDKDIWNSKELSAASLSNDIKTGYLIKSGAIVLVVVLPLYLLTNNQLPLYYITCSGNSTNSDIETRSGTVEDRNHLPARTEHLTRLAGLVVTGLVVVLFWILFKCKKKENDRDRVNFKRFTADDI